MTFDDYFDHLPLPWSQPITVGPFRLQARRTIHQSPGTSARAAGVMAGF